MSNDPGDQSKSPDNTNHVKAEASQQQSGVHRLFENIASLSVLQAVNYILPFVTVPYLVRVLGPDRFGLVAFAQAVMQYFIIFTDYGFNLSATREIASHRGDKQRVAQVFSTVMVVRLGLAVVGLGVLLLMVVLFDKFRSETMAVSYTHLTLPTN